MNKDPLERIDNINSEAWKVTTTFDKIVMTVILAAGVNNIYQFFANDTSESNQLALGIMMLAYVGMFWLYKKQKALTDIVMDFSKDSIVELRDGLKRTSNED